MQQRCWAFEGLSDMARYHAYRQAFEDLSDMSLYNAFVVLGALLNGPLRDDDDLVSLWETWEEVRLQENNEAAIYTRVLNYLYRAMSGNAKQSRLNRLKNFSSRKLRRILFKKK